MSDKKISELTELTAPDGAEELVVNDSGTSKKITQANLLKGIDNSSADATAITIDASENVTLSSGLNIDGAATVGTMSNTQVFTGESDYASRLRIGTSSTVTGEAGQGLLQIQGYTPSGGSTCGTIEFLDKRDNDSIVKMTVERGDGGFGSGELHIKTNNGSDVFSTNATFPSTGGITFNGDTAAANALDDYEEGTFSLSLNTSGNTARTLTTNDCYYTKIGQVVHAWGTIVSSDNLNDSNYYLMGSLPFIAVYPSGRTAMTGMASQGSLLFPIVESNYPNHKLETSATNLLDATDSFKFFVSYRAA